jgi:hypothetical protein
MLIECAKCGIVLEAEVDGIIRTILECAERESIYGGFCCEDCVKAMDGER